MAVLLHASSNATSAFIGTLLPNFSVKAGQATMVIYTVLALVLLIATKGHLSYRSIKRVDE